MLLDGFRLSVSSTDPLTLHRLLQRPPPFPPIYRSFLLVSFDANRETNGLSSFDESTPASPLKKVKSFHFPVDSQPSLAVTAAANSAADRFAARGSGGGAGEGGQAMGGGGGGATLSRNQGMLRHIRTKKRKRERRDENLNGPIPAGTSRKACSGFVF